MESIHINFKELPEWALKIVQGYGKRPDVTVYVDENPYIHGGDGIKVYSYKNGEINTFRGSYVESAINSSALENKVACGIGNIKFKPGEMVLTVTSYPKFFSLYVHPQDVQKLLPKKDETLGVNHLIVLSYTASLKSSYGGVKNLRFIEANKNHKITLDEWNTTLNELMEKKLLRKNKSITPEGRNQIPILEKQFGRKRY